MSTKSAKRLFVNALTFSRVPLIFIYLALAIAGNFSDSLVYPFAACVAAGKEADGTPVYKMYHLICKDGKAQTLEEIFGIE